MNHQTKTEGVKFLGENYIMSFLVSVGMFGVADQTKQKLKV